MPKTRGTRKSGRSRGRGRVNSGNRSFRASVTGGVVAGRDATPGSGSSVTPRVVPPPDSPRADVEAPLSCLLEMIREEVRQQLSMQAADRQPPASHAVPPAISTPSDVVSGVDVG